jgi:hypothetical protein
VRCEGSRTVRKTWPPTYVHVDEELFLTVAMKSAASPGRYEARSTVGVLTTRSVRLHSRSGEDVVVGAETTVVALGEVGVVSRLVVVGSPTVEGGVVRGVTTVVVGLSTWDRERPIAAGMATARRAAGTAKAQASRRLGVGMSINPFQHLHAVCERLSPFWPQPANSAKSEARTTGGGGRGWRPSWDQVRTGAGKDLPPC